MNRFTSSIFVALFTLWLAGCSANKEDAALETQEPELVEVITLAEGPVAAPQPAVTQKVETSVTKPAAAKTPQYSSQELTTRLKEWDQKLRFLTTSFTQTTEYDGVQVTRSQGTLSYDKEHQLLRLDTLGQDGTVEQSAITNKKEIVILDDSGKQVTTLSWEEWQKGQANQALFDFGNYTALLNRHQVKLAKPNQLALTPKEGEMYTLYVTLAENDSFPTELTIEADSVVTRAQLTQTQKNKPLNLTIFGGFVK